MVKPEAITEDYNNKVRYSFLISTEPHAIDGLTGTVSTKSVSVLTKRYAINMRQWNRTTWEETKAPGYPTSQKRIRLDDTGER